MSSKEINIYDTINTRNILKAMTDEEFDIFLPDFCKAVYATGFDNFVKTYNNGLKSMDADWASLVKKKVEKNNISSTSTVGLCIIRRCMPHIYEVQNYKGKSVKNAWTIKQLEKAVRTNRKSHSTPYASEIIRQLGFTSGTSKVTIYRPLLTKRIIQYFNAKNVLDVCVGWGGRMLGSVCVNGVAYTGIEPCSKTFRGLERMRDALALQNVVLYKDMAENVLPTLECKYDVALTSPPYYNLEKYSDEATQSHNYGKYEDWVVKFLKPVIHGVLDKLVEGGKSCWSVKNFKTDKKYNLYDDVVRLHKEKGWEKAEVEFYVGNCVRPGLKEKRKVKWFFKEIVYEVPKTGQETTFVFHKI